MKTLKLSQKGCLEWVTARTDPVFINLKLKSIGYKKYRSNIVVEEPSVPVMNLSIEIGDLTECFVSSVKTIVLLCRGITGEKIETVLVYNLIGKLDYSVMEKVRMR